MAIPSHGSDVDQFLDDLFMPVLDGNIDDGLSDARSLAASMKGKQNTLYYYKRYAFQQRLVHSEKVNLTYT